MVETKSLVHVPVDIVKNKQRFEDVKEGLRKAMTKGFYDRGLDFEVEKLNLKQIEVAFVAGNQI
jgi:Zn/Cd-binding protein ZinT